MDNETIFFISDSTIECTAPVARPDPTAREKQQVYKAKKRYNHFLKSYHQI